MKSILVCIASLFAFAATAAPLPGAEHDPHKVSADEERIVLPAVCRNAIHEKHQAKCAELVNYPSGGSAFDDHTRKASGELSLDTIAYGHFTAPNAQEAYVSYSGLESHSDGFGGGILLRGADSGWKVVRWFPGGQMDRCVAFPDPGPHRMLCLSGWAGMGETDSSVWVVDFGADGKLRRTNVLKAQDGREAAASGNADYYCKSAMASHRAMLLSIDDLTRGHEDGVLAASNISYASAADVRDACTHKTFGDMGESSGTIRYRFVQGAIKIDPPPKFAPVDY